MPTPFRDFVPSPATVLEIRRAEEKARRKSDQLERFRDLDGVEDDFRKIFCFARTAGGSVSVIDALEVIQELCRVRLGLPARAMPENDRG